MSIRMRNRRDPSTGLPPQASRCKQCKFNEHDDNVDYLEGTCKGRNGDDNIKEYLEECDIYSNCGVFKQKILTEVSLGSEGEQNVIPYY